MKALVHSIDSQSELWRRRMGHLHYRALPLLRKIVIGILEFSVEQDRVCKGCVPGKHVKATFPNNEIGSKGVLDLVHFDVCGPMSVDSISGYN